MTKVQMQVNETNHMDMNDSPNPTLTVMKMYEGGGEENPIIVLVISEGIVFGFISVTEDFLRFDSDSVLNRNG